MNFCDECDGMIVPEKEEGETQFRCRNCGELYEKTDGEMVITETKGEEDKNLIGEGSDVLDPRFQLLTHFVSSRVEWVVVVLGSWSGVSEGFVDMSLCRDALSGTPPHPPRGTENCR